MGSLPFCGQWQETKAELYRYSISITANTRHVYVLLRWCYLAGNSDEEVDHGVSVLLLHRLGEHGLCTRDGLATAKYLEKYNTGTKRFFINFEWHPCHLRGNSRHFKQSQSITWDRISKETRSRLCCKAWREILPGRGWFSDNYPVTPFNSCDFKLGGYKWPTSSDRHD